MHNILIRYICIYHVKVSRALTYIFWYTLKYILLRRRRRRRRAIKRKLLLSGTQNIMR